MTVPPGNPRAPGPGRAKLAVDPPARASTSNARGPLRIFILKPSSLGDVIHAQFGGSTAPFVVYSIERLGSMAAGVDAKP